MSSAVEQIEKIELDGRAAISSASTLAELEDVRIRYLGRKSQLGSILKSIAALPPEQRGAVGKSGNQARGALEQLLTARQEELRLWH